MTAEPEIAALRRAAAVAGELSQIMTAAGPLLAELEKLLREIAPDPENPKRTLVAENDDAKIPAST
ncbi:MAG: hypothetical protein QOJ13_1951 [Gaiellales bacterium]|nr:hypothetical protein [Gaiellales bacterium]